MEGCSTEQLSCALQTNPRCHASLFQFEHTKEMRPLNAGYDPGLDSGSEKKKKKGQAKYVIGTTGDI